MVVAPLAGWPPLPFTHTAVSHSAAGGRLEAISNAAGGSREGADITGAAGGRGERRPRARVAGRRHLEGQDAGRQASRQLGHAE